MRTVLASVLLPGDVLLTDGNTRMAALVRRVTRSAWSHVSMYVGPLEAGPDPRLHRRSRHCSGRASDAAPRAKEHAERFRDGVRARAGDASAVEIVSPATKARDRGMFATSPARTLQP
jgi:hypothetical protein